jgi:hypothetical protein
MTAELPEKSVKRKPKLVSEMAVDTEGFIDFPELCVEPDLSCYLSMDAPLKNGPGVTRIRVRREPGGYVVSLPTKAALSNVMRPQHFRGY